MYVAAFGLPIPILAATESAACETLAARVHAVITGAGTTGVPAR